MHTPADALASPRFTGPRTFARLPLVADLAGVDCAVFGIPWDGSASFRAGSRFGPEAIRGASVLLKPYNAEQRTEVFGRLSVIDHGDAPTVPGYVEDTFERIAAFTGRDAAEVTGRGTGIDDAMLAHKIDMVRTAVARLDAGMDPVAVLAEVGGLEQAALTGYLMAGAALRVPVVVDGVIADAALVAAAEMDATVLDFVVAGHRSVEPGAAVALDHLGLRPLLDLELRLGEGTGAILGADLLRAAAALAAEMATFDSAGVSEKEAE